MRKTLLPLAICAAAVLLVVSCQKNYNNHGTSTVSKNKLFADLRSTPQSLSVVAGRDTVVFGAKGTMLHFYTNSFKNAAGAIITSGTINLQLVEMYKPGDMIQNRATTMANGKLLRSGGQVSIVATMNNQPVYANAYGIGFEQKTPPVTIMSLFHGNTNNSESMVSWVGTDTLKEMNLAWPDSLATPGIIKEYGRAWVGYVFDSNSSLEYTNCDAFYNSDSPMTSVSVVMPDGSFIPDNTQIYLVLPDINCAMSTVEPMLGGVGYDAATNKITIVSEGNTKIVPSGMNYKLVVMASKNGSYYYYEATGKTKENLVVNVTMAAVTKADITTRLAGL